MDDQTHEPARQPGEDDAAMSRRDSPARSDRPSRDDAAERSRGDAAEKSRGDAADKSRGDAADKSRGDAADKSRGDAADKSRGDAADKSRGEGDSKPSHPWRRRLLVIGGAVFAVLLVGGGVLYWLHARNFVSTDDAFVDANTTQMAPQVAGRVTELAITDNQHVTAGQLLLRIDPRDYQAKLDQAKAQQANARAGLEQARAQVTMQQANVDQAEANVRVNEADLVQARQDYERYHKIDPHAVTRQQVDTATANFHASEAKLDASRQAVGGARAQLEAARAQVLAAEAQVQQADANVAAAALQLSYCTINAPVAGTIASRKVDVGNYVNPGQALFAIVQDGRWVTANFKETQLAHLRPGQPADLSVDAVPSVTFHGRVDSFQSGTGSAFSVLPAENATGNYVKVVQRLPVKIVFDDDRMKDFRLAPGMSVVPSIRIR
ncbi:MAG: biotin/lipoyl-binding protein [Rhodospirillales bacterium]|nr:biotin/lipoyl-binding protein [Rhodospirillales bacterium]